MKKILQVIPCLERGGTEAFVLNHYKNIDHTQFQFDFLVFAQNDGVYGKEITNMGGKIFHVTPPSVTKISTFIEETLSIIKKYGPYIAIHSHANVENAWVMVAGRKADIPVRVSHSHDTHGMSGNFFKRMYRKFQVRLIRENATDFLACSMEAGCYLYGDAFFKQRGMVIHNGIPLRPYLDDYSEQISKLREDFQIPPDCGLIIGNITRFERKKNPLFVVEVFARILKKVPNAILILGGPDGGMLNETKQHAKALQIINSIRFIGPRDDVPICLKMIDAYVFPSLYEGLPIALLEAQAAGCRCYVSNQVSHESDMGTGLLSFLPLTQSSDLWAAKIIQDNNNKTYVSKKRIQMCFRKKGYDITQSVNNLLNIYTHVGMNEL